MTDLDEIRPVKAANNIVSVLQRAGAHTLPLDVSQVAMELSRLKYPDDPIVRVDGAAIPGFEGALAPQKGGWGIFYNSGTTSRGRINFTLAHEYGHYELHRKLYPEGIECNEEDLGNWESDYNKMENQANEFAATLLMPFNSFRAEIPALERPNLDQLWETASQFDVSLTASTLRWLQYTSRRAMLVVSIDGFILWARSSKSALKTGLYYRTRNQPPCPLPSMSIAGRSDLRVGEQLTEDHGASVWLNQDCREHSLKPSGYDFILTLLHFDDHLHQPAIDDEEEVLKSLDGDTTYLS